MSFSERRLQQNALRAQKSLQVRKPIVAITQHDPSGILQHERNNFPIRFIGRGQKQTGEQTRPTELGMQTEAIKRLPVCMIFPIASFASEANTTCERGQTGRRELEHYPRWTGSDRS